MERLVIAADIKKISEVLHFIKGDMCAKKIDEHIQFNAAMVAEEVFSNIAFYAYQKKENAYVSITTEKIDNDYIITFIDSGKKYNPLTQAEPDLTSDIMDREIGGLGIFLSKKLSDDMVYKRENKQNILIIKFGLNK